MAIVEDMIDGNNLVPGVVPKMRYRSDIKGDAPRWIVSAIRNITDKYTFDELSVPGPLVTLKRNIFQYPVSFFTGNNVKVTRFDSFMLRVSGVVPTSVTVPTVVFLELKWRNMKTVSPLTTISGQPIFYTIYSEQMQTPGSAQVFVAFCPNQDYPVQVKYQRKHPFSDGLHDEILLPEAWLEVVACLAAFIGAQENAMSDVMQLMKATLYGDPKDPTEPGLIKSLVEARSVYSNVNERQITFISGIR